MPVPIGLANGSVWSCAFRHCLCIQLWRRCGGVWASFFFAKNVAWNILVWVFERIKLWPLCRCLIPPVWWGRTCITRVCFFLGSRNSGDRKRQLV
jgi:hypothetical protein